MDLTLPLYLMVISFMTESIFGLNCWNCFDDQCETDPRDNKKAKVTSCGEGQMCQKTYFEMYNDEELKAYTSTVRSCSSLCKYRNDFSNCTYRKRTTLGCIRKDCCNDSDLCNGSDVSKVHLTSWIGILVLYIVIK